MSDETYQLLAALDKVPKAFDSVVSLAGLKASIEVAQRLFLLIRTGWVSEFDHKYGITDNGIQALQTERLLRSQTAPFPKQEPEPSSAPSSARSSTLAPTFAIKVDRWGNPQFKHPKSEPKPEPGSTGRPKPRLHERN